MSAFSRTFITQFHYATNMPLFVAFCAVSDSFSNFNSLNRNRTDIWHVFVFIMKCWQYIQYVDRNCAEENDIKSEQTENLNISAKEMPCSRCKSSPNIADEPKNKWANWIQPLNGNLLKMKSIYRFVLFSLGRRDAMELYAQTIVGSPVRIAILPPI